MKHSVMCEYGIAISVNRYNYSSNKTIVTHLSYDRQMTDVISSKGIMFTLFAKQKPLNRCKLPVPHKRLINGTNMKDKQ